MFRNLRRSGPPPFQVMSNTWRSPRQDAPKTVQRAGGESPAMPDAGTVVPVAAKLAAEPAAVIQEPAPVRRPAPPKAQTEARRRPDPSSPQRRARIDLTKIKLALSKAIAWLGGAAIQVGSIIADKGRAATRGIQAWSRRRAKAGQLPRRTVVIGFAALAAVILLVAWLNSGDPQPLLTNPDLAVTDSNLDALKHVETLPGQPANPGPVQPRHGQQFVPPPGGIAEGLPRPRIARTTTDPREKGQRYYVLATYRVAQEKYAVAALEYLWSQGVEAAAINGHNSGDIVVVALQGFTREQVNQGVHKPYEDQLRAIGRRWKAAGGADLAGIYAPEYKGGPITFSLTKAN